MGLLCVALLLMSLLSGATAVADVTANYADLAKIMAVVCFVGSMAALAFGMVSSTSRPS